MKKLLACLISLTLALSVCAPVFAEDSAAKSALEIVKEKIDVPESFTEFEYNEMTNNDEKGYYFYWHDEEYDGSLNVSADEKGKISNYNYYASNLYSDEKKLIMTTKDEALRVSDEFIRRVLPEMFENENDTLVLRDENTSIYSNSGYKSFSFKYERMYGGIYVRSNIARVDVVSDGKNITVQNLSTNIDYDATFDTSSGSEVSRNEYMAEFPVEVYYTKVYEEDEEKVYLAYVVESGIIDAESGKKVSPDTDDGMMFAANEKSAATADSAGGDMAKQLSPKELEELSNMNALIPAGELEKTLRSVEELKITDEMKLTNSYTQKLSDGGYRTSITLSDDEDRYLDADFDAATGKLLYVYNSAYGREKLTDDEKKAANDKARAFIEKMNPDEVKETEYTDEETEGAYAVRLVNGIRYPENFISASYSAEEEMLESYRINWDKDVSMFPDPEKALDTSAAYDKVFETEELRDAYVKTDGVYRRCKALEKGITIDALTGEELYKNTEVGKPVYTDIDGHWAEDMIKTLADNDIYLEGEEFRPDEGITQKDMFRLFGSLFFYTSYARSEEPNYNWLINQKRVLTEEEKAPDKIMTREEGFRYFARMAGWGDIAKLDIFKQTFEDSGKFVGEIGSAEILRGMGVIGADGYARPDENLTRAEAAAMIYNYLAAHSIG